MDKNEMDRRTFLGWLLGIHLPPALSETVRRRIVVIGALGADLDKRLAELGFIDGQNVSIERPRWDSTAGDLRRVVDDAVKGGVDVIVACGSLPIRAAIDATRRIPIVMVYAGDPIGLKFVSSLSRPGGNVTGMAWDADASIAAKVVELFKEALPEARGFAVFGYAEDPSHRYYANEARIAFQRLRLRFVEVLITSPADVEPMFRASLAPDMNGIIVLPNKLMGSVSRRLLEIASKERVPVLFAQGGSMRRCEDLICYGPDITDHERRAADYVARILKGARPGELAIEQSSRITLQVNLRAAQRLGLVVPQSVLLRADQVIR